MSKNSVELKPCPFCGGEAKVITGSCWLWQHAVECKDCGANTGYKSGISPSVAKNKAVEAWNRREPIDRIIQRLEGRIKEAEGFCSLTYESDIFVNTWREVLLDAIEIVKKGGVE